MKKRNSNSNRKSIVKVLAILFVMAAISALLSFDFVDPNTNANNSTTKPNNDSFNVIYLVPSRDWASDGSGYVAWCFGGDGFPAPGHASGTFDEETGLVEFIVPKGYTQILFIDLKPGTNFNGNWDNKRDQSADLEIPVDGNVYYHQYANEWRSDATFTEPEIVVTTENKTVMCATLGDSYLTMYVFNKLTGEGNFIGYEQNEYQGGVCVKTFTIPAGYTHCIFVVHTSEDASWDNVQSQTADLVIPSDNKIVYNLNDNLWVEPVNNEE